MNNNEPSYIHQKLHQFGHEKDRSLLDQLLSDSRLYTQSKDYKDLLDFVVRLRNFAPFNAMLLQLQRPGLSYAATLRDWYDRFGRRPKEGARPLLILMPFAPVALVYDVLDTEGKPLPDDVANFIARGDIDELALKSFGALLREKNIDCLLVDEGDRSAGAIRVVYRATSDKEATHYQIKINRNHDPAVQFGTLAHELAHLFLGHLGSDQKLKIRERYGLDHSQKEIEAESVAFIVCGRKGIELKSQSYLSGFVDADTTIDNIDVYQIMKAAGQVESLLKY